MQYFNPEQLMTSARSALRPRLLVTMGGTLAAAVFVQGMFSMGGGVSGAGSLLLHFIGSALALFILLFGLTALAHQLYGDIRDDDMPDSRSALSFAWKRIRALILLPAWAAGGLFLLLLAEILLLVLGKIPGLGLLWLSLIGAPLLLLNTVIAVLLLLALFNIAARVAIGGEDAAGLRGTLWRLLRHRLPELLIYNLGGVVATVIIATIVLSPLWLGAQLTWVLADVVSGEQVLRISEAAGFWGGLAHLLGLAVFGALLAAVASIPGVIITRMTLLIQLEMDDVEADGAAGEEAGGST